MEGIDEILLKVVKHLDNHSISYYKQNGWEDREISKALKKVCEPEIKKLGGQLLIKFLRWQYDDDGEFTEGDKAMVNTFLDEFKN